MKNGEAVYIQLWANVDGEKQTLKSVANTLLCGTGLGLSIAHTIVTTHGGSIKVIHNEPKGTIFIIKL